MSIAQTNNVVDIMSEPGDSWNHHCERQRQAPLPLRVVRPCASSSLSVFVRSSTSPSFFSFCFFTGSYEANLTGEVFFVSGEVKHRYMCFCFYASYHTSTRLYLRTFCHPCVLSYLRTIIPCALSCLAYFHTFTLAQHGTRKLSYLA